MCVAVFLEERGCVGGAGKGHSPRTDSMVVVPSSACQLDFLMLVRLKPDCPAALPSLPICAMMFVGLGVLPFVCQSRVQSTVLSVHVGCAIRRHWPTSLSYVEVGLAGSCNQLGAVLTELGSVAGPVKNLGICQD